MEQYILPILRMLDRFRLWLHSELYPGFLELFIVTEVCSDPGFI